MPQYEFQMTDFERIFRKRYKLLFAIASIVVVFSIVFGRMKPSRYQAAATVKVERSTVSGLGMETIIWGDLENIETQTEVVTSFPVLLGAAKRMGLIPDSISEDSWAEGYDYSGAISTIRSKLSTSVGEGTKIISIHAESGVPQEARDVANAVALAYKEFSMHSKRRHAARIKKFIEEQLAVSKEELRSAEQDVKLFEEGQEIPSLDLSAQKTIDEAASIKEELAHIDEATTIIREQRAKLDDRYRNGHYAELRREKGAQQGAAPDSAVSDGRMSWVSQFTDGDPGLSQLNSRLIQLQIQLDDQLAYYHENHPASKDIEKKIQETIGEMLSEYGKKLDFLNRKKQGLLSRQQEVDRKVRQLPANQMEYTRLVRRLKVNEELYTDLSKKYQEAMISEAGVVDDVTIMSMATLPKAPINKNTARMALVGAFLGLLLGTLFAVVREMFDTSIGTIEDVERTLKLAVLAVIPHIQLEEQQKRLQRDLNLSKRELSNLDFRARLVTQFDPKKPIAEAYRILRTNIEYLSIEKPIKTIHVTSATMQEGKSTTIANLAVAFAQQGKDVLLLECNLRRPSLYRLFGVDRAPGIADILIERHDWRECVKTVTDLALGEFSIRGILNTPGLENLHLITYGRTPPNPAEILSSAAMDQLLKEVREEFDIVLVDAPPLLPVADSMVLSTKVDAVVLIYKVGSAPRSSLSLARERLATVQANVLGIVLNDIRPETSGISYTRLYARYYGKEQKKKKGRSKIFRSMSKKA